MRLGDLMWKQTIELRSRNFVSALDDERLEAIYRWTLRDIFAGFQTPRGLWDGDNVYSRNAKASDAR